MKKLMTVIIPSLILTSCGHFSPKEKKLVIQDGQLPIGKVVEEDGYQIIQLDGNLHSQLGKQVNTVRNMTPHTVYDRSEVVENYKDKVEQKALDIPKKTTYMVYTVSDKETLGMISMKLYGTTKKWPQLVTWNTEQLKSPDDIKAGMKIKYISPDVMTNESPERMPANTNKP